MYIFARFNLKPGGYKNDVAVWLEVTVYMTSQVTNRRVGVSKLCRRHSQKLCAIT